MGNRTKLFSTWNSLYALGVTKSKSWSEIYTIFCNLLDNCVEMSNSRNSSLLFVHLKVFD